MTPPAPFVYPPGPHLRRHAPAGYLDYRDFKPWLRDEFEFRCVYCLQREMWSRDRAAAFSVDHVVPQAQDPAGLLTCAYGNLIYACNRCNSARQDFWTLDPTAVAMGDHVRVEADGRMVGLTEVGQFLIELLHLDSGPAVAERNRIYRILKRGLDAPEDADVRKDYREAFGYPEDLPDLQSLRPPNGNQLADNVKHCFHARRIAGILPETY
jgi:hypothetical protein